MGNKLIKNRYIMLLLITGAVYFFLKYLSPILAPAIIAVLFLTMFYPALDDIQKKTHIKKQFLAVMFIIFVGLVIGIGAWILVTAFVQYLPTFVDGVDTVQIQINRVIGDGCDAIGGFLGMDARALERDLVAQVDMLAGDLQEDLLPQVLGLSMNYARGILSIGGFIGITVIATVLLAKDYDRILDQMAEKRGSRVMLEIVVRVIKYIATFVKAQLLIMLTVSSVCVLFLSIFRIEHGFVWGLLAGILDVLPFVGTGIVLLPLAIWQLLQGAYAKAVAIVALYLVCVLIREMLEPKLIGDKVGVYPVGILIAVYAGLKLFGFAGLFLGPIGLVMIQQVYSVYRKLVFTLPQENRAEAAGEAK